MTAGREGWHRVREERRRGPGPRAVKQGERRKIEKKKQAGYQTAKGMMRTDDGEVV